MNSGRTVFAQLLDFLPLREFQQCVERYRGNFKVKSFTCLDQFLCLAFAQLTYRESLRDIGGVSPFEKLQVIPYGHPWPRGTEYLG